MTNFDLAGELECVWQVRATCGEGPLWIEAEQSLYFVDIDGKTMHCYGEKTGSLRSWELEEKTGWILPRSNHDGFEAGCQSGVYFLDKCFRKRTFVMVPDPDQAENRFNDA